MQVTVNGAELHVEVHGDDGEPVLLVHGWPDDARLWRDQVRAGLVNLGWPARDAEQAIAAVAADLTASPNGDVDVSVALRAALRKLSRA